MILGGNDTTIDRMAPLTPKGDLAIAEVAFFSLALILSAYVVIRHGFNRQLGWLYLIILSLLRLIGASCSLYIEVNNSTNVGLYDTTAPFLCVRVLYTVVVAFESGNPQSVFYYHNVDVYVTAFMQFLMEAAVVCIFVTAGLLTPRKLTISRQEQRSNSEQTGRGLYAPVGTEAGHEREHDYLMQPQK